MHTDEAALMHACEVTEAETLATWFAATRPAEARALGVSWRRVGGAVAASAAGIDHVVFNLVIGLGVREPARESHLNELEAFFRENGARRFMVTVVPGPGAEPLEAALASHGFARADHWVRLVREVSPLPEFSTDLATRPLAANDAPEFGRLTCEVFGHTQAAAPWTASLVGQPGWQVFGAFDGPLLVAVGGLFVHGSVGWLGVAATRASHRGRGAQSALICARVEAARAAGATVVTVETAPDPPEKPNPSTRNLRRMGFREFYRRPNWIKTLREA